MFTKKSFTLVELLIVIIIVGILAAVSIPIFRGYIWRARYAEVYAVVGMAVNAKRLYHIEHDTYEGDPSYSQDECRVGNGIPTGSTRIQQDLGIEVDENCFFQYIVYPRVGWGSPDIFFKEPGYNWAWYYSYAGANKGWHKYSGDGGPAQEYFSPP